MRREQLFDDGGHYRILVESNVLLHQQAAALATAKLAPMLRSRPSEQPLRVLDLACGGWPVTIARVMGRFPGQIFEYTGIDINPDQVELAATRFEFPPNVRPVLIIEGNAWDLDLLGLFGRYDLLFSGMNLHHGTPEELLYLARQLRRRIAPGGMLFSHDVYRPDDQPYWRRPDIDPADPSESFRLVDLTRLQAAQIPPLAMPEAPGNSPPGWRQDYLDRMHRTLLARQGDAPAAAAVEHMRRRDYPVSAREFSGLLALAAFVTEVARFDDSPEPLAPYVACCIARPREQVPQGSTGDP